MKKKALIFVVLIILLLILFLSAFISNDKDKRALFDVSSLMQEKPSPSDHINDERIQIFEDKIVILTNNSVLVRYANTNSMDPTLDEKAKGIEIKPSSPEDIRVGDIISYRKGEEIISHRVIKIGKDKKGWYCITKGDNTKIDDGKIRFNQIVGILVVIIY